MSIEGAVAITVLALLAQHYAPWQRWLGVKLPRLAAYTLGTLALAVPLGWLFIEWQAWESLKALALVVITGGATVAGAYLFDAFWEHRLAQREAEEREAGLRQPFEELLKD